MTAGREAHEVLAEAVLVQLHALAADGETFELAPSNWRNSAELVFANSASSRDRGRFSNTRMRLTVEFRGTRAESASLTCDERINIGHRNLGSRRYAIRNHCAIGGARVLGLANPAGVMAMLREHEASLEARYTGEIRRKGMAAANQPEADRLNAVLGDLARGRGGPYGLTGGGRVEPSNHKAGTVAVQVEVRRMFEGPPELIERALILAAAFHDSLHKLAAEAKEPA